MDTVEEQLRAYNTRDLVRFLATLSLDIVIEDGVGKVLMRGRDPMRKTYGAWFDSSPALRCRVGQRLRIGHDVVDAEEATGIAGSPTPKRAMVVYRVGGDKIVHLRMLM